MGLLPSLRLRIDMHPCLTAWETSESKPKALMAVEAELSRLLRTFGLEVDTRGRIASQDGFADTALALYRSVQDIPDDELDRLSMVLVLLSFGQSSIDALDTGESLFNRVAADLGLAMREWWTPDAAFLALLRKDQLEAVAVESGASLRMGKLKGYGKKELVNALAQYFARTADPAATLDEHDQKGRSWVPGAMSFPACATVNMAHSS